MRAHTVSWLWTHSRSRYLACGALHQPLSALCARIVRFHSDTVRWAPPVGFSLRDLVIRTPQQTASSPRRNNAQNPPPCNLRTQPPRSARTSGPGQRFSLSAADRSALWSSGPRVSMVVHIATEGENSAAMTGIWLSFVPLL
jgi:hypothetical protein